ncbi:MAG: hypothetical protein IPK19_24305 [Chloroflexi bacterium]|nr:hypothetical protein [Chloroflexota bacterium]
MPDGLGLGGRRVDRASPLFLMVWTPLVAGVRRIWQAVARLGAAIRTWIATVIRTGWRGVVTVWHGVVVALRTLWRGLAQAVRALRSWMTLGWRAW